MSELSPTPFDAVSMAAVECANGIDNDVYRQYNDDLAQAAARRIEQAMRQVLAERDAERERIIEDVRAVRRAFGLFDGAMPISPREALMEVIRAAKERETGVERLRAFVVHVLGLRVERPAGWNRAFLVLGPNPLTAGKGPGYRTEADEGRTVGSFWWPYAADPTLDEAVAAFGDYTAARAAAGQEGDRDRA